MSLSIGIVGLPNVGKSTLFNALTRAGALASNYPFATIKPNVGVVGHPRPAAGRAGRAVRLAKIVPATVRFVDIAGLVRGASEGQGLGNQFLVAHPGDRRDLPGRARLHRPGREPRGRRRVAPARHRDDRHRADPGRSADAGEGRAPAGQGGKARQGRRTQPGGRCRRQRAAAARRRDDAVRGRGGGRHRPGRPARTAAADGQAVPVRVQRGRRRAGRRRAAQARWPRWSRPPSRSSSTPRPRRSWPSCPRRTRPSCSPSWASASPGSPSWPGPASPRSG